MAVHDLDLNQGFGAGDAVGGDRVLLPELTDTTTVTAGASALAGLQLFEVIALAELQTVNNVFHSLLSDATRLQDDALKAYPQALAETIDLAAAVTSQDAVRVIEQLGVGEALGPAFRYTRSIAESISLATALARFFGAQVVEDIAIGEIAEGPAYKVGIVSEALGLSDTLLPRFVLRVVAEDGLAVADADLPAMLYNGLLSEAIELSAAYIAPGRSVTTWAMNTRTGGVTEYQNYDFNSFARIGARYFGASASGFYELTGEDDDGTDVVATIRSGFAQWAGAHLHSFKGAYLAVRGSGDFVLRLITGDGAEYNYAVTAESMRTARIRMGKGLRARYFAFELVSTGQGFDLETLEFIPLVADRRV